MQFECVHVKTTKEIEETHTSKGKIIVLKCDLKSKEERVKCEEQHKNERIAVRGNIGLQFRNRLHESRVTKVIKKMDSMKNLEEHVQKKHREKWKHIDLKAREFFSKITLSKIKCAAGLRIHVERMKLEDKKNKNDYCLT